MQPLKFVLQLTVLTALSVASLCALADDDAWAQPRIYIGGGVGYDRLNGEDFTNTDGDLTKNRVSWKAQAGIKFNPVLSLEGQYIDFGAANRSTDRVQAKGWTAGLIGDIPVSPFITPYVKAGAVFWKTDNQFNNISNNDNGTGFTWGGGVRFKLTDNIDLRAEYERFRLDSTHVDNASTTIQFNF
jgi:opacity protein-like surface antigen